MELRVNTPWSLDPSEVANALAVDPSRGLAADEAAKRLERFGANRLREPPRRSAFRAFLGQFADWMIGLLAAAALVSAWIGEASDAVLIGVIVLGNAIIGFFQERRAEQAVAALRSLVQPSAFVWRDGALSKIAASDLTVGDLIELKPGAICPADSRLIEASELQASESPLTGESMAVEKQSAPVPAEAPLAERASMTYAGTAITQGHARAVVTAIGMETEVGHIATLLASTEASQTPLQRRLSAFSRGLAVVVVLLCAIVFLVGTYIGKYPPHLMFLTAVSLAVAAIPEGLPAVITVTLAIGSRRMSRRKAIVRQLSAVETLGSVDVICADKTGTLTQNKMSVRDVIAQSDNDDARRQLLQAMILCNDAQVSSEGSVIGSPTEAALLLAATEAGIDVDATRKNLPRVAEFPFSSQRKRMSSVHRGPNGETTVIVKGAPEALLQLCNCIHNVPSETGPSKPAVWESRQKELAEQGRRVLAVATKAWPAPAPPANAEEAEADLNFIGIVGIVDPPREEAKDAIALCHTAAIRVVMITGDNERTALAIARELGLWDESLRAVSGPEIDALSDEALLEAAPSIAVYSRVSPHHKLRIVRAHQARGSVVAMTGDGVNDAPALKQADIGVAMGIAGADVSKESARMVLADDNFATIVAAVEEGRVVYDNIRKFIRYLLTANASEIILILLAILANLPLPLLPIHLLWINLVTDGPPALALGYEPVEPGTMQKAPRRRDESIFSGGLGAAVLMDAAFISAVCMGLYCYFLFYAPGPGDHAAYARTAAFLAVASSQLFFVLGVRSAHEPLIRLGLWNNWRLTLAVLAGIGLQALVTYIPFLQKIFHTVSLRAADFTIVLAASLAPLMFIELRKVIRRFILRRSRNTAEQISSAEDFCRVRVP